MKKLDKKNIREILALTPIQEGLLFHYLQATREDSYFNQLDLEVSGDINPRYFEAAWNFVLETNEMLRTVFRWEKLEKPSQVVLKKHALHLKFEDLSGIGDIEEQEKQWITIKQQDRNNRFDLRQVPFRVILGKMSQCRYHILIDNHHILYDGWSTGIILKEFFQAYESLAMRGGGLPLVPRMKARFKEFIRWHQEQDRLEQKKFWQHYLGGFDSPSQLSSKQAKQSPGSPMAKNYRLHLSRTIKDKLDALVKDKRITLATVFYCAWGVLLQKYSGMEDVVFGITVSGRSAPIRGIEDMVGLFINTIPLRAVFVPGENFPDFLLRINNHLAACEKYESTSLVDIYSCCRLPMQGREELFDSLVSMENYPLDTHLREPGTHLSILSYAMEEMPHYDLTLVISTGEGIDFNFIYKHTSFAKETIVRLANHFSTILKGIVENVEYGPRGIELLSEEERQQLLVDFNRTAAAYPKENASHELFEVQAEKTPDSIALIGVKEEVKKSGREKEKKEEKPYEGHLSYRVLSERSGKLAGLLIEKGVRPDTIVGIMTERSLEMIVGIMGILKSGGAYLPIDPDYPQERIDFMLKDSGAKILLTQEEITNLSPVKMPNIGPKAPPSHLHLHLPPAPATSLAYIIYTSGSTGKPKGVMVEHGPVVNLLFALQRRYPLGKGDTYLLKTSYLFDVSVTELFGWFLEGGRLAILEPDGEKDPKRILEVIAQERVTHINFVPSMFHVFVEILDSRLVVKLAGLKHIFLAGEALPAGPVNRFRRLNTSIAVENIYGPTEATVYAGWFSLADWKGEASIPIGKPLPNVSLYIVDKWRNLQPIEVPGELCIGGDGLARGYLNNPELTVENFLATEDTEGTETNINKKFLRGSPEGAVFSKSAPPGRRRLYKTGDLTRWLPDGIVEFLGRIDQQVKIRGFRIEPGEIEKHLANHPKLKDALVTAGEYETGEKYLCAYVVPKPGFPSQLSDTLIEYLVGRLPDYMVPAHVVMIDKIPLNPNGKVDLKALPKPVLTSAKEYSPPRGVSEKTLVNIWARVLDIEAAAIGIDDSFFRMGGHSLKVTRLILLIHKELKTEVPFREIFAHPTVRELAAYIDQTQRSRYTAILPVEEKEHYPLSPAQRRLFVMQQMEAGSTAYNINGILEIEGSVDKEKFEAVFRQLISRHESLRTSFQSVDNEPVQRVYNEVKFEIIHHHVALDGAVPAPGTVIRPFDLSLAPLLRVGFIDLTVGDTGTKNGHGHAFLMIDMHHIISDGASIGILVEDFLNLYRGAAPRLPRIRYRDYSRWLSDRKEKGILHRQETYWLNMFSGEAPRLNLPTDIPRPAVQGYAGAHMNFELTGNQSSALTDFAIAENTTFFVILLALYYIFLAKLSGQEDIVVGTPVEGRLHIDLSRVMGMFVNMLAVRNYPSGEKSTRDFVREVRDNVVNAFENQEYPFEELVEHLNLSRDAGRNPLFDVAFTLQEGKTGFNETDIPGLKINPYPYDQHLSKFDLTFTCTKENHNPRFTVEYCTEILGEDTIDKWVNYFKAIVSQVIFNKDMKIGDLEIISPEEKQEILSNFNRYEPGFVKDKTIRQLFREQVERTPDHIALVENKEEAKKRRGEKEQTGKESFGRIYARGGEHLSYNRLNERIQQLACYLFQRGVKSGGLVGIMAKRSIEMIVGILAILKTGCGYVPLNPDAPTARNRYILEECNLQFVLSNCFQDELKQYADAIDLTDADHYPAAGDIQAVYPFSSPGQPEPAKSLAYVIYTSGSTGKPKGVPITHANLSPLLHWGYRHLAIGPSDHAMQNLSYFFDWSVWEIFITLTTGAALYLAPEEVALDMERCIDFLKANTITILHITPTQYSYMVNTGMKTETLRCLFIGAEKLTYDLVQRSFSAVSAQCRVFNLYGPTEATIISAALEVQRDAVEKYAGLSSVPIGKAVGNTDLLILDRYLKMCPVNIPGELVIGGEGIAEGYLNNPELTAEKFLATEDTEDGINKKFLRGGPGGAVFSKSAPLGRRRLYKTGDLARWLPEGQVEYLGRIDHQVKIRGYRIELGEIENQILCNENVKEVVVLDKETKKGEKFLCAYIVPRDSGDELQASILEKLKIYLSHRLPDYMIPAYILSIENLPLNPNGKVDRKALPELDNALTGKPYSPPRNPLESKLVDIWREILDKNPLQTSRQIGIDDNFFEIGGHSLKAVQLTAQLHKEFQVKPALVEIFKMPTIRGLAEIITKAVQDRYMALEPVEKKEYYALSSAQKRLYILRQMDEQGTRTAYNIPSVWTISGDINKEKFAEVFQLLTLRHESLRTSFHMVNEEPVQRIHSRVEFEIEYYGIAAEDPSRPTVITKKWSHKGIQRGTKKKDVGNRLACSDKIRTECYIENFIRPFDLSCAPLLRVGLLELTAGDTDTENRHGHALLIFDMHHIISDGTSMNVLVKDFMSLYRNMSLPPLKNQYKDFSERRNSIRQVNSIKQQERYWLNEFPGEIPVLELPTDYTRPPLQDYEGGSLNFEITPELTDSLGALAVETGTTLYILLLAIYTIFLSKLSSREDIVVGAPVAGRRSADLEKLIGVFVNTLAMRNYPLGEKRFGEFLAEAKERALRAFDNQEYPYEDLVEKTSIDRDLGRNPLFDTMFVMQNMDKVEIDIPGLKITPVEYENQTAKFDLTLTAVEVENKLLFTFTYRTKLFKRETIERYAAYFREVIRGVLENKERPISTIEIITREERNRILSDFNATNVEYPDDKTIFNLFAEQVEKTPDCIALVALTGQIPNRKSQIPNKDVSFGQISNTRGAVYLSYRELNNMAERQAHLLIEQGVQPDTIVAVKVERSVEMIVGILGILKAGGAYLPIDPDYPQERIDFMLKDSDACILLTGSEITNFSSPRASKNCPKGTPSHLHLSPAPATSLAYIIYTSGTTGKPKGVMVEHRQAVNTLLCRREEYRLDRTVTAMQLFSFSFDGFVTGFFTPVISGSKLVILSEEAIKNSAVICKIIFIHRITHFISVPALYMVMLESAGPGELKSLQVVTLAGDTVSPGLVEQTVHKHKHIELALEYGVTEAAVMSTLNRHQEKSVEITIGKPTWNTMIYILGTRGEIKPVGIPGELCIGGWGLSRGYLNNPELTVEKILATEDTEGTETNINKKFCGGPGGGFSKETPGRRRLYKTGDLARWRPDGCIEFLGRIDHQVKIRGFRVELGEIENRLLKITGIKKTLVLAQEGATKDKYLCAYFVSNKEFSITELQEKLEKELPGYMIPSYFVKLEKLPLTATGKIDRRALPQPELRNSENYAPPVDEIEKNIVEIWSSVLGIQKDVIGLHDNFFHLGGHSLKATLLAARISRKFNVEFLLTAIFTGPTVKEMSAVVRKSRRNLYEEINPVEKNEYYPMSSAQKRLFFLEQLENIGTSYNTPTVLKVEGELDKTRFIRAVVDLIQRHEAFRTSFCLVKNEPVQVVHDRVDYIPDFENIDHSLKDIHNAEDILEYSARFLRPFDLSRAPLIRIVLVALAGGGYFIFYDTHHIISDGTSLGILVTDFIKLYFHEEILPLKLRYKDFTLWQNHRYKTGSGRKPGDYWLNVYGDISRGGKIPRLNLPTDYPRPYSQSFSGDQYEFKLESEDLTKLNRLNARCGSTLYMNLLAVFNVLLYKYTDQEDIIVGSGIDERIHKDLQGILGMFVNTLPLRNHPGSDMHFSEFLKQVRGNCISAFENQDMQFEELVEQLKIKRDPSRNPLFDVEFNLQNFMMPGDERQDTVLETARPNPQYINQAKEPGRVRFSSLGSPNKTSKFDMILFAEEVGNEVLFSLEYSTALFKRETIKEMARHYFEIIRQVTANEEVAIKDIRISHDFATATPEITVNEFGF